MNFRSRKELSYESAGIILISLILLTLIHATLIEQNRTHLTISPITKKICFQGDMPLDECKFFPNTTVTIPVQYPERRNFTVTINKYGRRDRARSPEDRSRSRIIFLGDSNLFGWGLENNETITEQLQQQLDRECPAKFWIENWGIPGYGIKDIISQLKNNPTGDNTLIYLLGANDHISENESGQIFKQIAKRINKAPEIFMTRPFAAEEIKIVAPLIEPLIEKNFSTQFLPLLRRIPPLLAENQQMIILSPMKRPNIWPEFVSYYRNNAKISTGNIPAIRKTDRHNLYFDTHLKPTGAKYVANAIFSLLFNQENKKCQLAIP